jgi:hypothetical protein
LLQKPAVVRGRRLEGFPPGNEQALLIPHDPGLTPPFIAASFYLLGAKRGSVGGRQLVR